MAPQLKVTYFAFSAATVVASATAAAAAAASAAEAAAAAACENDDDNDHPEAPAKTASASASTHSIRPFLRARFCCAAPRGARLCIGCFIRSNALRHILCLSRP